MPRYNPARSSRNGKPTGKSHQTFRTPELPAVEKLYVLDMFPYPSGDGLHVGHPEGYTATHIVCRFERMRWQSVLHPMGLMRPAAARSARHQDEHAAARVDGTQHRQLSPQLKLSRVLLR